MRDRELDRSLGRFLDGEPEPEDGPRLAEAMRRDPSFGAEVRRLLATDDLLRQHAEPDPAAFLDAFLMRADAETGTGADLAARIGRVTPSAPRRSRLPLLPWLIAAVACGVAIVAVVARPEPETPRLVHRPDQPADRPEEAGGPRESSADESIVALLVNEAGARFAEGAAPDAVRFRPGVYELTGGAVHLRFSSGADVVIPSPARFAVRDPMHMTLESGSLRALVSPSARGFTVAAPGVDYEDLGTEFGVSVEPGRSRSEVHVFEGAVDLKSAEGETLSSLTLGQSASVAEGRVGPAGPIDPSRYPTPDGIGLLRWREWRDRLAADPTLLCYYSFEERTGTPAVLPDAAGRIDGRIDGARWVSGRWPGKQALLFDRPGDAVEVTLPGESRRMTIAAWVRVERLDFELNAIFDSDEWEEGDLHFQLYRSGVPSLGFFDNHDSDKDALGPVVSPGRWTHVAAVVDLDRDWSGVYVDGVLANVAPIVSPGLRLRPGTCRIGHWRRRPDWEHAPDRDFRGRIDELAIWDRALSEAEIRTHVEAGRPSLLSGVPAAAAAR